MTQINPLADYAKHRSPDAFAQIVEQYQRLILATCRRKLHHPADLDDAVQETFLRLAQNAGTVRNNVGGWLYTCAVNVAIDINRRQSSRHRHESAAAMPSQTPDEPQQQLAELREHLDAALLKLEPAERELIIQRYFVGRPQVELAADAGVSASAISHRLDQAIENLRRHLSARGCAITAAAGLTALLETEHASAAPPPSLTANVMKIGYQQRRVTGGPLQRHRSPRSPRFLSSPPDFGSLFAIHIPRPYKRPRRHRDRAAWLWTRIHKVPQPRLRSGNPHCKAQRRPCCRGALSTGTVTLSPGPRSG
jgi:RNA polymerase sigma factor (sigma-70 family)